MNSYIALLRGINVGGKGSLPMKELTALLARLGAREIKTYIQSGNAVFQTESTDLVALAQSITRAIEQERGFAPHVLLLRKEDLETAIAENPFPEAEAVPASLHLGFLDSVPRQPDLPALEALRTATERFVLRHRVFYLHAPDGVGRSKLAAKAEKLLGVPMTDRNWNTVRKLWEMVNG